ncbi:MAG TPA: hypothetical protein VF678_13360, partial [bacterium]
TDMARKLLLVLAFGVVALGGAYGQTSGQGIDARCTKPDDRACIDWERQVAIAVGTGAPASWAQNAAQKNISAERAARLDAARNLLELIKGVALTSDSTVSQSMVANDAVNTSIQGELNSIRSVDRPKYFSDGSVQVKLEASLRQVVPAELYAGPPRELGAPAPAGGAPVSTSTAYTGLVLDARGLGVNPAMSPKVYDPDGREVYGSAFVSRDFAVSQGIVGYVKSVEQAQQTDRVKGNPAVVKVVEAKGPNKADLVVSKDDAERLRTLSQQQTFLREARVLIVVD